MKEIQTLHSATHSKINKIRTSHFAIYYKTNKNIHFSKQASTVHYSTIQYSTVTSAVAIGCHRLPSVAIGSVQYSTVQYSTVQYSPGPPRASGAIDFVVKVRVSALHRFCDHCFCRSAEIRPSQNQWKRAYSHPAAVWYKWLFFTKRFKTNKIHTWHVQNQWKYTNFNSADLRFL